MVVEIKGRKVKIATGEKSQTVNICTEENNFGDYECIYRIKDIDKFIKEGNKLAEKSFSDFNEFYNHLREKHNASQDGDNSSMYESTGTNQELIMQQVKEAVNDLTREFYRFPYKHRVEHSLHCSLYNYLMNKDSINNLIDFGNIKIGRIHKEWPETFLRDEGQTTRGAFDFGILGDIDVNKEVGENDLSYIDEFKKGMIAPLVAIELGLDYDKKHLESDIAKLKNSIGKNEKSPKLGIICHYSTKGINNQKDVLETIQGHLDNNLSNIERDLRDKILITCCFIDGNDKYYKELDTGFFKEIEGSE